MRFLVICDDPSHMPWAIPVDGSPATALEAAVDQYDRLNLVRPIMVIDYEESATWRVGRDESGWFLSDSATTKMGLMTPPDHIPKEAGRIVVPVEEEEQAQNAD